MKRFSQCVCILLVLILILATPAFAAESSTLRSSDYFVASSVYLWEISSTQFQVWFEVTATGRMDELGVSVIKVQRSTDTDSWTTVRTYYKEDYSNMICKNTSEHSDCVTYTYSSGYYYRAYVELYAKNSEGTAYYGCYTSSIYV